jgi:hypothetical protein
LRKYLLIAFIAISVLLKGQILDTSDAHNYRPISVTKVSERSMLFLNDDALAVDTPLNYFYNYYPTYKNNFPFLDLGQEGSAALSLSGPRANKLGFQLGISNLEPYFFNDSIHIYQTEKPFTRLNYSQGNNEMLTIEVTHAQQISKRLSFGVDYRRLKNQNFYYSNISNASNLRMSNLFNSKFYTGYYSKDRRYEMVFSYLWNKSRNVESGGLVSPDQFELLSGRNKVDNNEAAHSSAFGSQNQNKFTLLQFFRPQSNVKDSSKIHQLSRFNTQAYLKSSYEFYRSEFEDNFPDSLYYGFNTEPFKDSINLRSLQNEFGITANIKNIRLVVGLDHSFNWVYMNESVSEYHNLNFKSAATASLKQFKINGRVDIGLFGYNQGDYDLLVDLSQKIKSFNINAGFRSQLIEPMFLYQTFISKGVSWNNNFVKTSTNQLFGGLSLGNSKHKLDIYSFLETSLNPLFFGADTSVKQYDDLVSLFSFKASYQYTSKIFGFETFSIYQESSNQQVLPRPRLSAQANVYAQFRLFQKNLLVQTGVRGYWFSEFNAPRYIPITKQWHNTDVAYTAYPPFNFYVNSKVKSFNFGVELFHVQMGLMNGAYYSSPAYPLMPRTMRLNIKWDLNN